MEPNETEGLAPESDTAQAALMQDLATVHKLADEAMGNPQVRRLAMAVRGLCQVVEHLAGEVEVLKAPKPCEGCEEGREAVAQLLKELEALDKEAKQDEVSRGFLARAAQAMGWGAGN